MSRCLRSLLFHWFVLHAAFLHAAGTRCDEPDPVANAYRSWEGGSSLTWVNYTCLDGYDHLEGDLERQCTGGGYTGTPPLCLLNCGPPLNYTHSIPSVNGTWSEQYANYTCIGNRNQTSEKNLLFCDPAPGRWESPVYCAERETIMDSIRYLPLSTSESSQTDESTSAAEDPSQIESIDSTANNVFIIASESVTLTYSETSVGDSAYKESSIVESTYTETSDSVVIFAEASMVITAYSETNTQTSVYDAMYITSHLYGPESPLDLYPSSNTDSTFSFSYPTPSSLLSATVPLNLETNLDSASGNVTYADDLLRTLSDVSVSLLSTGTQSLTNQTVQSTYVTNDANGSLDPSPVSVTMPSTTVSDSCPRQNRLLVELEGGPYEILHVILVRPPDEDLYNFHLDVYSPSSACYSASRLVHENRTTVSCNGDRLFPIGERLVIQGSDPDHGTLRICDVEVYGRVPSVDCGIPDPYPGRRTVYTTTSLNSSAVYYCERGYHYRGGGQWVNCTISGFWENYELDCSDKEKLEPLVTTANDDPAWTDNDIETCSSADGSTLDLTLDLGSRYEVKMVTITTPANSTGASLTVNISRDGHHKICSAANPPLYTHQTGEVTAAVECSTAPVGDKVELYIGGLNDSLCEVKVFGRPYSEESVECLQTSKGTEFKGTVNMTVTGLDCQPWKQADMDLDLFPDMTWDEAGNHCRNPNNQWKPWCYTDLASSEKQDCPIVLCDSICLRYPDGSTYRGSTGTTSSGDSCMSWSDSYIHFKRKALFPDNSVSHSKCRNPTSSMRWPWCYTSSSLHYGYCSIPTCPKQSEYSTSYFLLDHLGVLKNLTDSGFTECFIWKKGKNSANRLDIGTDLESHVMGSCGHTFSLNMTLLCSVPSDNKTSWLYTIAECVDCGKPSVPSEMVVNYTTTFFPSTAKFSCAPGYVWDGGTGNFTCLGTGQWDNATLQCIADCGVPPSKIGTENTYNRTVLDSVAIYRCLITNETTNVTCLSSRSWEDPVWQATCPVNCRFPPSLSNMNVTYNVTYTGDTAVYACGAGYQATGGSGDAVCQGNGVWSTPTLSCKETSELSSFTSVTDGTSSVFAADSPSASSAVISVSSSSISFIIADVSHLSSPSASTLSSTPSIPVLPSLSSVSSMSFPPLMKPSPSLQGSSTLTLSSTDPSPEVASSSVASVSPSSSVSTASVTTTPTPVTSPPTSNTTLSPSCLPLCFCGTSDVEDKLKIAEIQKEIKDKLLLDEKTLSKEKRKLTSASDTRPSAQAIGHSAWIILVVMFGLLLISDIVKMVKGVARVVRKAKRFTSRFAW